MRHGVREVNVAYNSCAMCKQGQVVTHAETREPEQLYAQALQQGRFMIQQCRDCGMHVFPPRASCEHCGAADLRWVEPTGRATVLSVTLVQRPSEAGGSFGAALIELEEGPRLLSRVMDVAPEKVTSGMAVSAHVGLLDGELGVVFYNKEQGSREW